MSRAFELVPEAEDELWEQVEYYEAQAKGLGSEFLEDYERTLRRALEAPHRGYKLTRGEAPIEIRRFLFGRFPFALYVSTVRGTLRVYAVGHQRRRPGYWVDRLAP